MLRPPRVCMYPEAKRHFFYYIDILYRNKRQRFRTHATAELSTRAFVSGSSLSNTHAVRVRVLIDVFLFFITPTSSRKNPQALSYHTTLTTRFVPGRTITRNSKLHAHKPHRRRSNPLQHIYI